MKFDFGQTWIPCSDADPEARALFDRHYSRYIYADGRRPKKFIGPGEYLALMTPAADALCVWRKFIPMDDQTGVNCAIYRTENPEHRCSDLLREAEDLAWQRWPGERLYTYINPRKVRSPNPGY